MAIWTNQSRNTAAWSNSSKSDLFTFDQLPLSTIEANTFDGIFMGKPLDDGKFDDLVSTQWSLQARN